MMRASLGVVVSMSLFTIFTACDDDSGHSDEFLPSQAPKPKIDLRNPTSTLRHTSTQPWQLAKTGSVNPTASTVTWQISATQGPAGARSLVVSGNVDVRNTGGVAAPIGNIALRLQSKSGSTWTTRSVDVANSTFGDAATAARVVTGTTVTTMTENDASGALSVPLSPSLSIGANSTVPVAFTATFNNDVLGIAAGTVVRAEILFSWGSAGGGNTPANVDINGNGLIDPNETRVDGGAILLGEKIVAAATPTTTPVTLSDTLADIATSGSVTFSNAVFAIGQTTGTVTLTYDGGPDGGTIRNCAHLTGTGINLETCSTQIIEPEPFEWQDGDVVTLRQGDWDVASMLTTPQPFSLVFPTGLVVGTVGAPNRYSILLTNGLAVQGYLATGGANTALTSDHINPTLPFGGLFGGDLVATTLNVGFSAGGQLGGTFDVGDLYLCELASPAVVNNTTVASFVATANALLGGDVVAGITIDEAQLVAAEVNAAFLGGVPSAFADQHLSPTPCP